MTRHLVALAAIAALTGCSSAPAGEVKLGVDIAPLTSSVVSSDTKVVTSSDLAITGVRLLVDHAKIGYTGGGKLFGGPAADAGPVVVDLTAEEIAKGAHREFSLGALEAGTYGGAEIEIQPPDGEGDTSADAFADFVSQGASVLVDGTYGGKAWSFAGHFLAEQGTDGEVTIDASSPAVLSLSVDTSSWFRDAEGAILDPSDSTKHDALAVAVCKTLDTEPQLGGPSGAPTPSGSAPMDTSASDGVAPLHGGHGGPGRAGPGGGGGGAHCVEKVP